MTKPIIPAFLRVRPTYRIIATRTTLKLSMHKTFYLLFHIDLQKMLVAFRTTITDVFFLKNVRDIGAQ